MVIRGKREEVKAQKLKHYLENYEDDVRQLTSEYNCVDNKSQRSQENPDWQERASGQQKDQSQQSQQTSQDNHANLCELLQLIIQFGLDLTQYWCSQIGAVANLVPIFAREELSAPKGD